MFGLALSVLAALTTDPTAWPRPAASLGPDLEVARALGVGPKVPVDSRHLGPQALPPTDIRYRIDARLDPDTRTISARERVEWRNPSERTIESLPVHLYLNAFSHAGSTWFAGVPALRGASYERYLDAHPDLWGRIDIVSATRGEAALDVRPIQPNDGNPFDRSLAEIRLDRPLPPGETLTLDLEFTAKLPVPMARTGGFGDYFHVAQWFPKVGAWDPAGKRGVASSRWGARQFHGPTEFYANFADYDVTVEVPSGWAVVGTGEAQPIGTDESGWSRTRFTQDAVHDFAWVASNAIHVETHPFTPKGGGGEVAISYVVPTGREGQVERMRAITETSFDVLGARVGPYPYSTMKIVEPPMSALGSSGMEYPTLVTGLPSDPLLDWPQLGTRMSETTIAHEITHNYFYGLVANDEQQEAFLDEGFTSYWEAEIVATASRGTDDWATVFSLPRHLQDGSQRGFSRQLDRVREPILRRPAYLYYPATHTTQIYMRSAATLLTAANRFGQAPVDRLFAAYFARWRFRHPTSEDFFTLVDELGPPQMAAFLREAHLRPQLPDFAVEEATVQRFRPPLGHVPTPDGVVFVTRENQHDEALREVGLDPIAYESGDRLTALVHDPGFAREEAIVDGQVIRVPLAVERVEPRAGWEAQDGEFFVSHVMVRGPAWDHLPVTVRFTFADGVAVEDQWDARASWRGYRFLRSAPLDLVWIDPDKLIRVDANPDNNGRRLEPDTVHADRWTAMLSRVVELVVAGGALWL
ncbi:MAG: M1 family metallopeptidase [Myxococcales bacterium FL481]|nr:MAG: M1 family metallopeptidase [Myxococcales bacterium FL481]